LESESESEASELEQESKSGGGGAPVARAGSASSTSRSTPALFSPALRIQGSHQPHEEFRGARVNTDEDDPEVFNPYSFIAGLPVHSSVLNLDKICLPSQPATQPKRPTLALDLDETLVHSSTDPPADRVDMVFPITFNHEVHNVYVRKRPHLEEFLEICARHFEVVVFTASQMIYADVLLDKLDPHKRIFSHRLFRDACLLVQGNYIKDLHVLGRDLARTVLVDNSPHAFGYQIDNGIPIESWYDDQEDTELLKLVGFLNRVFAEDDVRPSIRAAFRTDKLVSEAAARL